MFTTALIFFLFTSIEAETEKDRYVVRENISFQMDCNHKLENVTRVRWEYIKTQDNRSETIYDSQSNGTLNTGFEFSCEPHDTFISTCILKLVRPKKEDSGKYICYVGDKSETKLDSNLKPIVEIELVIRGPVYKTLVAKQREAVVLPCEHNIKNLTRARWSHVSLQGVLTYAIFHMPAKETSNKNYESLCQPHQLYCNLKILQANKESAGRYICMVGESLEFEEKYGLDQMTYFIEIQLVVGELTCNKNMNKDLTLLGENDCYGIEADVLNLKCSFNYFGNINYNILHLRWIEKYKFNSLEKKLNSSLIKHEMKGETNKISIQTNLSVAYEMKNSVFQCVLDDTLVKPCTLHEFGTQYIKNTTQRLPPVHSNDLHNIKCSANKSSNVQCSYYWVHEIGGALVENPYAILPVENMNSPGNYTCIAKCHLKKLKHCIIKAMEVEVIQYILESSLARLHDGSIASIVVIIILLVMITIMIYLFLKMRCSESRMSSASKERNESVCVRLELLRKEISEPKFQNVSLLNAVSNTSHSSLKGLEKELIEMSAFPLEVKETHVERTSTHGDFMIYESCLESMMSSAFKRRNELIKKSTFPLEVKKTHVERTSKHGDFMIYESKNVIHGNVLMIDGAIWDTSSLWPTILDTVTIDLLKYHPNPKKVLLIGRCEGRIVKGLLLHPGVESINVCDFGESDQAKELHKLYCEYFPKLARNLYDPKVLHLNRGVDFLKNQQNVFDVIITRSSYKNTDPNNYLFCYEYCESVKSALKKGGIAMLIVSGQSAAESEGYDDFVEHDIQCLYKRVFSVVQYLRVQNSSHTDHSNGLTRYLICALEPKKNLKEVSTKKSV